MGEIVEMTDNSCLCSHVIARLSSLRCRGKIQIYCLHNWEINRGGNDLQKPYILTSAHKISRGESRLKPLNLWCPRERNFCKSSTQKKDLRTFSYLTSTKIKVYSKYASRVFPLSLIFASGVLSLVRGIPKRGHLKGSKVRPRQPEWVE